MRLNFEHSVFFVSELNGYEMNQAVECHVHICKYEAGIISKHKIKSFKTNFDQNIPDYLVVVSHLLPSPVNLLDDGGAGVGTI